ncbi:hypothetical protein J2X85_004156 [Microbacterium trichothecenolyticum]|uniref:hypothetical protein n=1 Tax=Microbacterium trichothecenolyticum TaxID=69370 RepID=UPI002863A3FA|nr:hypothetical protein [Microbacterium trichothecenolyticum]MDR7187090.1 hypothetical protein [Microbacterium trichothecenolyticum]
MSLLVSATAPTLGLTEMGYPVELETGPGDGRAEQLAPWIREMDLADQVFITGATLILERIRLLRNDLPYPFDEARLREGTPDEAYGWATDLSDTYANQPPHDGNDGVDEHRRISTAAREIAGRIAKYHPEVLGRDR